LQGSLFLRAAFQWGCRKILPEGFQRLDAAEHDLRAAEEAHARAEQTSRAAAELVKEARAQLNQT